MEAERKRVTKEGLLDEIRKIKETYRLVTITCVDHGEYFEIIYHLSSREKSLNYSVLLKKNEDMESISKIFPSAALYEGEIHDFFGIKFKRHPKLEKLFLPDDWKVEKGHPLRKNKYYNQKHKNYYSKYSK